MTRRLSIFTALLLLIPVCALAGDDGLKVSLRLEASRALIGIPVGSELILENRGKAPLHVPRRAYYRIHSLTTGEWVMARSMKGPHEVDLRDSARETIAPGGTVRIADFPALALFSTILGSERFLLEPGTYMVDVLVSDSEPELPFAHENDYSSRVAALFSSWVTPAVELTIEEPRGEDIPLWAKIAEVTQNGKQALTAAPEHPADWIRPLAARYPDSAYVPYFFGYCATDDSARAAFTAKWLARELPPSVKEWLLLHRARALAPRGLSMNRADPSFKSAEDEALSIARELAKQATVPGMKEEAQRIVDDIDERRNPAKDTDDD